jgi:hypothetical protein
LNNNLLFIRNNLEQQYNNNNIGGIIIPDIISIKYDPNDLIGKHIFGSSFEPSIPIMVFLICLFVVGAGVTFLTAWNFISRLYVWWIFATFPFLFYAYCILNIPLAKLVLQQEQTILLIFWNFVFVSCWMVLFYNQVSFAYYFGVILAMIAFFFSILLAALVDAFPSSVRVVTTKLAFSAGLCLFILNQVALYYNWMSCTDVPLHFLGGIKISASSGIATALWNIIMFLLVSIVAISFHPDELVTLRCPLRTAFATKNDIQLIHAMDWARMDYVTAPDSYDFNYISRAIARKLTQ